MNAFGFVPIKYNCRCGKCGLKVIGPSRYAFDCPHKGEIRSRRAKESWKIRKVERRRAARAAWMEKRKAGR